MTCCKFPYEAARKGHVDCLIRIHRAGQSPLDSFTCCWAAAAGNLDCLKYAHRNGAKIDSFTCYAAAEKGHLDCLEYAYSHCWDWGETPEVLPSNTAANGHLDCLEFLHRHGCPWNANTTAMAAKYGHLACLKYAHEHGCPWDFYCTMYAAESGHLACLSYAHERGCPWDTLGLTCNLAAKYNRLACLRYAHENGCPWNGDLFDHVILPNACSEYAKEHMCGEQGPCITCLLKKRHSLTKIDWNSVQVRRLKSTRRFLSARRVIYKAMETAYLNPHYAWCVRRLKRDYENLMQEN